MKLIHKIALILSIYSMGIDGLLIVQIAAEKNSPDTTSTAQLEPRLLHGRWHQTAVTLTLDHSDGLGAKAEESIKTSIETQRSVKEQIQNGKLAIITQFNHDGTYTHELVYENPEIRFPAYRETGTWSLNKSTNVMSRKTDDPEGVTTLEQATVKSLDKNDLVLEARFTEGDYKGIVETIKLRRVRDTKTSH